MLDNGKINKENYDELVSVIKEYMEEWRNTCAIYNNPEEENLFLLFLISESLVLLILWK